MKQVEKNNENERTKATKMNLIILLDYVMKNISGFFFLSFFWISFWKSFLWTTINEINIEIASNVGAEAWKFIT